MSRVYSAMTGAGGSRPAVLDEPREDDEEFVAAAEDAPFVEVGGPSGTVFSPTPAAEVRAKAEAPAAREFPRIATPVPTPAPVVAAKPVRPAAAEPAAYLSVRFHDTAPRVIGRAAEGPDPALVALFFPNHPVSDEYRTLRDEIAKQLPAATSRAVLFTAATPEAGTSTVLLNLAITLANAGQRVLALDANFTRPGVATKLALRGSPGLAEVLGQNLPLSWALQQTAVPSLQALTAGSATDATAAAIGRDLPRLLVQLRQWFDWVLIDGGVWGVVPDRDSTCPAADAVYLVTREADADRPEFTGLRAWVKELGGSLRGYVTTRA